MKCFVCQAELLGSKLLIRHFKLVYGFVPGKNLCLKCVEAGKHLNTKHAEQSDQNFDTTDNRETAESEGQICAQSFDQIGSVGEVATTSVLLKSNKSTLDMCASAVAQLKVAGLSQSAISGFVSSMEEVVFEIQSQAKDAALLCLSPNYIATKRKIESSIEHLKNQFTLLNSEAKRKTFFREMANCAQWLTVEPTQIVFSTRFDSRRNKTTATFDQVVVTDKFAYIPILETLKSILQNPHLIDLFKPRHVPKEGVYVDLSDAAHFKSNPLFYTEKDTLQIQLFYDDFETANPLGSKKRIHKLGALDNIHLCALFHAQDIRWYGFNSIIEPLVNDLKVLEIVGVKNPVSGSCVRGTIGDFVQRDDKHWYLLLLLLQIVNIIFSPTLTEGMTIYLKHLIIEHHQLFKKLFPEKNLLPKHHIMIHYPQCIRKIGPILHMWCMRYEAKHKFFKTQLKSFKNITKTLAKKHQSCMAMHWEYFSQYRLTLGPGKMVELSGLKVELSELVYSVKWIKHHGTEYRPDFIICPEVACEMPVFCKIKTIAVKDENVLLCGTLMETLCFDDHYHAFTVRLHPDLLLKVVNVNELCYFKPFDVQMKYGTTDSAMHILLSCATNHRASVAIETRPRSTSALPDYTSHQPPFLLITAPAVPHLPFT
ncbi:hypothetical protein Q7C36_010836 [Tachysurus vachellii]|uniref:Uncharacterized protein n=1 Tax=Tachysurus vachellii TaxID=175792 RepID=A0AA88MVE9_TACVA|nr:hypothetical protein Q7C36_010836 [Tachysurus vachellii]